MMIKNKAYPTKKLKRIQISIRTKQKIITGYNTITTTLTITLTLPMARAWLSGSSCWM